MDAMRTDECYIKHFVRVRTRYALVDVQCGRADEVKRPHHGLIAAWGSWAYPLARQKKFGALEAAVGCPCGRR
jgi:hypothetical protein